jgi:xanthine dehydrogenase YagR molybdenum-binding subunit
MFIAIRILNLTPMEDKILNKAFIEQGLSRIDGKLKVTGRAKYSAEYSIWGITYGVLVGSTITSGSIKSLDTKRAERAPGVLAVITYLNCPNVPGYHTDSQPPKGPLKNIR